MKDIISVIVPVYNVEKLLDRCLESLINQSYSDIEIIVVDDGSTDGSSLLCDAWENRDGRIRVFHKKNGGLSDARNYGMQHATGNYYSFIDSDDVVYTDFFKTLIDTLKKYDADIVSTDIIEFYNDEELKKLNHYETQRNIILTGKNILSEYFVPKEKRIINHGLCMKLYRKELFNDLKFDVGRLHEDLFITYKLLDRCRNFVYVDVPYYCYYQNNNNSISNNYKKKNFMDEFDCVQQIQERYTTDDLVKNEAICFCIYHYLVMLNKICGREDKEIKSIKNYIRKWILLNLGKTECLSGFKKVKVIFGVFFPTVYETLKGKMNVRG